MAETSKNKIYYNDNENSIADVLTDMKKMAESTDEAIEKSKYDDTEIKNKDTEQDSKIEELQNQKTELEKELKEMQEDYYQTSIRGQASGEYIHVEDSSGARCKIGISGNSEQETRSGKNLFKPLNITSNEITTTYDKDGVGTIKGTSTNTWANISANVIYSYPAGNYVLSIDKPKTFNIHLKGIYTDKEIFEFVIPAGSKTKNVAFKKEVYSMYTFISGFTAGTTLDDTIKIQLEKGSTATAYEQYGLMPSPDYLSKIKTVGDNVNLYDKDNEIVCNGIGIGSSGELFSRSDQKLLIIPISQGKTNIAISFTKTFSHSLRYAFSNSIVENVNSEIFDADYVTDSTKTDVKVSKTITNNKYKYLLLSFIKSDNYPDLKIEYNSTPTSYSSYGQGSVKVTKCNKNLSKYKTFTSTSSARVVGDTTTSGQQIKGIKVRKGKKYTISFDVVSLPSSDYRIQIRESTDESVAQTNGEIPNSIQNEPLTCNTLTRYSKTITAQGDNYLYIRCIPNGFVLDNIQVEEKEISTSSEQHEEQSYIMPVQQEMLEDDYFDWDNEEVHTWNKLILDGTENWEYDSTYNYFRCPSYVFDKIPSTASGDGIKQLSNYFSVVGDWNTFKNNTNLNGFNPVSNIGYKLVIRNTNYKTIDTFKAWLKSLYDAGIPVVVYYKLATPTRLAFTEEQKAVAKELNNVRTYKNVTNITTDSIAILDLDYAKDLEKNKLEIYSTEEQVIGTWVDGKTLYRKVFDFGQLPVTGRKEIKHGISNLNKITKLYGIASWKSVDMPTIPLPSADPDGGKYSVYLSANSSIIAVTTGSDRGAFYGYIIIEYTKTTD